MSSWNLKVLIYIRNNTDFQTNIWKEGWKWRIKTVHLNLILLLSSVLLHQDSEEMKNQLYGTCNFLPLSEELTKSWFLNVYSKYTCREYDGEIEISFYSPFLILNCL